MFLEKLQDNPEGAPAHLEVSIFSSSGTFSSSFTSAQTEIDVIPILMRRNEFAETMVMKKKMIVTFCFLLPFFLLFFSLLLSFCFGSLGFFEADRVPPASFSLVLGVGELFLARYPLVVSAD